MTAGPALIEEMLRLDWTPVNSSNLEAVAYVPDFRRLYVSFQNGSVYSYLDVPESIYRNLIAAQSKGQFLDRHVKKAMFGFVRVQ